MNQTQAHDEGEVPQWAPVLVAVVVAVVFAAETGTDLSRHDILRRLVTVLDVGLVAAFSLWVVFRALRTLPKGRRALWDFLVTQRIDIGAATLSVAAALVVPRIAAIPIMLRFVQYGFRQLAARRQTKLRPARALAVSFLSLISVGTLLLCLPAATVDGEGASLVDAAFISTSAVSTTGLVVVDTGTYWSTFGLVVILAAFQIGALGTMVLATAFAVLVGGSLPSVQRDVVDEAGFGAVYDVRTLEGIRRVASSIVIVTIAIEGVGTVFLWVLWAVGSLDLGPNYDDAGSALWWCLFHSISAFCNAGFSLEGTSLMAWKGHLPLNLMFIVLITVGGMGFPVMADLWKYATERWRGGRALLHLQTKVVLVATALMNTAGLLVILYFEYGASLQDLTVYEKLLASAFQSVSLRSAGFNTVDIAAISAPTLVVMIVWMFIGSGPGSTGGGIRVTTATVVVMAVRAMLRNREDVEVFGRRFSPGVVYRSISIVLLAGSFCAVFLVLLTATQNSPFDRMVFEVVSAFGCTGLSMGSTGDLDTTGKWLVTGLMYLGRVGPITMALAIGERLVGKAYRYPEGKIAVG